uniref:Uncharacterized protein n=1 Tax=Cucumis sativus TaxID=3659 RepID=A0A0A0LER2_CUCSA
MELVAGDVEAGELGSGDVELELIGTEYEPKYQDSYTKDDDYGDEELEKGGEKAAGAASAVAVAMVGLCRRRDGRAVKGAVEMGLFVSHIMCIYVLVKKRENDIK